MKRWLLLLLLLCLSWPVMADDEDQVFHVNERDTLVLMHQFSGPRRCTAGSQVNLICRKSSDCPGGSCPASGTAITPSKVAWQVIANSVNPTVSLAAATPTPGSTMEIVIPADANRLVTGAVCAGGANNGTKCTSDATCTGGGYCRSTVDVERHLYEVKWWSTCVSGANVNQSCTADSDCTGSSCWRTSAKRVIEVKQMQTIPP